MTQNWVRQIVSSFLVYIIGILTQFGVEKYRLRVGITIKISVSITDFYCLFFGLKFC